MSLLMCQQNVMKSKNNILQETDTLQDATLTSKVKKQDMVST